MASGGGGRGVWTLILLFSKQMHLFTTLNTSAELSCTFCEHTSTHVCVPVHVCDSRDRQRRRVTESAWSLFNAVLFYSYSSMYTQCMHLVLSRGEVQRSIHLLSLSATAYITWITVPNVSPEENEKFTFAWLTIGHKKKPCPCTLPFYWTNSSCGAQSNLD